MGTTVRSTALPSGWVYGYPIAYVSATTATLGAGNCRDYLDASDISQSGSVTLDITAANGALGLNTLTSSKTWTTAASSTVTASADVWTGDLDTYRRTLTGTFATTTTTLTGTSSKLLSEVSVGDIVRVGAKGASRITAIASDTSATLVAALPDGDASAGSTAYVNENMTFKVGSETARLVNTINNAGTSLVMSGAAAGTAGGQTGTYGVEVATGQWIAVYAASISGSGTGFLSTRRTTPYTMTGLTGYRRVGWIRNDSSGNFLKFTQMGSGLEKTYRYVEDGSGSPYRVVTTGADTSWTTVDVSAVVPPFCSARCLLRCNQNSAIVSVGVLGVESGTAIGPFFAGGSSGTPWGTIDTVLTNGAQVIRYTNNSAGNADVVVGGFVDAI